MIATHNEQALKETNPSQHIPRAFRTKNSALIQNIKDLSNPSQLLLPNRIITHNAKAGINPLVDAAGYLFSTLGQLKQANEPRDLSKLQRELILEINRFQLTVKNLGYNAEYLIVCRYILCATFDDIITAASWGSDWHSYVLQASYHQEIQDDKFFSVLERTLKEPTIYIDLMELLYLCLSLGYQGLYKGMPNGQLELEKITNNLYRHIRAYRGNFSKALSPTSLKLAKKSSFSLPKQLPLYILFLVTACIIMTIFVSLSYLMDAISNEAYQHITAIENPVSLILKQ